MVDQARQIAIAGTEVDVAISASALMSGMIADTIMLVKQDRVSASDVDCAMQLGAGYPKGPLAMLGISQGELQQLLGVDEPTQADAAVPRAADAWAGPIGLIGSGTMAGGIAESIARSGRPVLVLTRSAKSFEGLQDRIATSLARSVEKARFSADEAKTTLTRIIRARDAAALAGCALVIEAVKEDLAIKRATFAALHTALPSHIPFASNTSSFSVADLADDLKGRTIFALHFFNPAQAMKLVELVFPASVDCETRRIAIAFARAIGKTPVECADQRGFVVNRLLLPFLNDAVRAHESGVGIEVIDRVMVEQAAHPMGPFALIDLIGLDVMILALESIAEAEADPRIAPADSFYSLVERGRLGRKSGAGFYGYSAL